MIRVRLDTSEIPAVIDAVERMPNEFVAGVLQRTVKVFANEGAGPDITPVATNQLARPGAVRGHMTGEAEGEILFDSSYASFVHDGTSGASGTKGSKQLWGAIENWAKVKGIPESLVFPITRKIAREGVKSNPWVNDFVESRRMTDIMQRVAKQVVPDVA